MYTKTEKAAILKSDRSALYPRGDVDVRFAVRFRLGSVI